MWSNKYSASYINADSNFEIYNMQDLQSKDQYHSMYCLLMNLLQRGCPTKPSTFMSKALTINKLQQKLRLFSKEAPYWGTLIKGHDETNNFPARTFYYEIIPEKFPEYPFLQQILIPEVPISEIVNDENKKFKNQAVDFFISEANLIIEIDGSQHRKNNQHYLDLQRDQYLNDHGFRVIRIPAHEMRLSLYIDRIRKILTEKKELLSEYKTNYDRCTSERFSREDMKPIAVMRFQIAIIQFCINGQLSLNDAEWRIAIKNKEITGYEIPAIEDLFVWIKNLCILSGVAYNQPSLDIQQTTQLDSFSSDYLKIEFSLFERRNETGSTSFNRIYISQGWRQDVDYFKLQVAEPIEYVIDDSGIDKKTGFSGTGLNEKRIALRFFLKNIYDFDDFRPGQERIVINTLKRRDTIGVLPTGSGKSLCYQMATLLQPCISFCICPIKSLMIDQDQNLKVLGIDRTAYISSDLTTEEREQTQKNFATGRYWWVFMSPERFQSEDFRTYLSDMSFRQNINYGYAVIDEVHCLSEWGHSFRVSYLNLIKTIRRCCPNIAILGLTATASYSVLKNILIEFEMKDKRDVISIPSFTRPELKFKVNFCNNSKYTELKDMLKVYLKYFPDLLQKKGIETRCGIIFTPFVNGDYGCFPLSQSLSHSFNSDVRCFGGDTPKNWEGLENEWFEYKRIVQKEFKINNFSLLCATKAFGMGIDKPNVRYTIHYGIPNSLESLYQEAGRAGRDKNKAECTILYTPEDELNAIIRSLLSPEASANAIKSFVSSKSNWKKGHDAFRQLFLLGNELSDIKEELLILGDLVQKHAKPSQIAYIRPTYPMELGHLQKYIYHLTLIGVVSDWTVNWRTNTVKAYFANYTPETILTATETYIQNYDPEYNITKDPLFSDEKLIGETSPIERFSKIFLTWYSDNILYTRRQALLNVMDACDAYTEATAEEFKEKMEAYFRLDDVSDMLGTIADQPREVHEWFEVLSVQRFKKNKVSNIIMNINRFLESYQNNVGLNFVSGILNLVDHHFDSPNGRARLLSAFESIKDFKKEDKEYILKQSAKLIAELSENDEKLREEYSEFFIRNFDYDETDTLVYKELQDYYSLQTFMHRMMAYMIQFSEGEK